MTTSVALGQAPQAPKKGPGSAPPQSAAPPANGTRISPAQAQELFASIHSLLSFASSDSHLKDTQPVQHRLLTRDEVTRDLARKMDEDKSVQRMQRSELVLKKFGLLDRDFALRPFLLSLLSEQVAAYYDPKTHTINLLDWVEPEQQKPVLAHELTHALQDDRVDLEEWGDPEPDTISRDQHTDNERLQMDEDGTARGAVTEGQAMAVFIDYGLKGTGKTLANSPEFGERLKEIASDTTGSPVLARAPLVLQESLVFPYVAGVGFEQALLAARGVDGAFGGALDHPPTTSHEILHPEDYLAGTPQPVLAMPDVHDLLDKDWSPYDIGDMGELDVRMLAELFGGAAIADPLAVAWDGGLYYAAQRRNATAAEKASTSSIGLVYFSQWKNRDSARSFLKVYAAELPRKYDHLKQVDEGANSDPDHMLFTSEAGDVVLSLVDRSVFISEGFPRVTATHLETKLRDAQGSGPMMSAHADELTMGFSRLLPKIGMLRVLLPQTQAVH